MAKQTKVINGGVGKFIAMTFIGLGLIILGIELFIIASVIFGNGGEESAFITLTVISMILIFGPGLAFIGVGIPCWIAKGVMLKSANKK